MVISAAPLLVQLSPGAKVIMAATAVALSGSGNSFITLNDVSTVYFTGGALFRSHGLCGSEITNINRASLGVTRIGAEIHAKVF